jgi:hypothetical protein
MRRNSSRRTRTRIISIVVFLLVVVIEMQCLQSQILEPLYNRMLLEPLYNRMLDAVEEGIHRCNTQMLQILPKQAHSVCTQNPRNLHQNTGFQVRCFAPTAKFFTKKFLPSLQFLHPPPTNYSPQKINLKNKIKSFQVLQFSHNKITNPQA